MFSGENTWRGAAGELQWPGRVVFGAGQLVTLGEEAKRLGRRAFLVTTWELSKLGTTGRLQLRLESTGLQVLPFEDVQPDPTSEAVDAAAKLARSNRCDVVIALGGGSAIDLAKVVTVAATHPGPIWDYVTYTGANARSITGPVLPLIAVPTTAGTGSEVTHGAVLDNPALGMKVALLNAQLYARVALIDPELTYTLPPQVTAMTGFDALTHGIESFLNVERTNPGSELFALEAVRRVAVYLPRVLADPQDHEARAELSWAATCGGLCITLSNASVAHAMALPLGARLGIPHGLALSRLQPVVLAHTWQVQPERCARLAEAVGAAASGMSTEQKAEAFVNWIRSFVQQIGLASLWTRKGVDDALCTELTKDVFAYMGRPVSQYRPVFSPEEIQAMFAEALLGAGQSTTRKEAYENDCQ
jgi:alcohol dehydrogenase class IV